MSLRNDIDTAWANFLRLPFPAGLAGTEAAGVELAELDGAAAGCVSTFHARGELDERRMQVLEVCRRELRQVLPSLSGDAASYFADLLALADLVAQAALANSLDSE